MASVNVNLIVEFLGTFISIYAILQSYKFPTVKPFVIAAGIIVAEVMFGSVSGGHFNPAVTAMMYAKGNREVARPQDAVGYIAVQILGGMAAWEAQSFINEKIQ